MKRWIILTILTLTALTPLLLLNQIGKATAAPAALHYVAVGGDCGGMSPCYGDVQTAVSAAASGDEIRIAQGIYTGTNTVSVSLGQVVMTQVVFISQSVQLHGGYSVDDWENSDPIARPTILDAEENGRVISIFGGGAISITGLRLTNGYAETGGGLRAENDWQNPVFLTMRDNNIYSNTAELSGGGILSYAQETTIIHNRIANNKTTVSFSSGGGIFINSSDFADKHDISNNQIVNNYGAESGGGIAYGGGSPESFMISNNEIMSNTALSGGGIFMYTVFGVTIYNNRVQYNQSKQGGGLAFLSSFDVVLDSNLIQHNSALTGDDGSPFLNGEGGGIAADFVFPLTMTNNIIADNHALGGGGLSIGIDSDVRMFHNTVARNSGGGILMLGARQSGDHCYSLTFVCTHLTMSNTLMFGHTTGISVTGLSTSVKADGVLWHSTPITTAVFTTTNTHIAISNAHWGDPLFAADGYHLTAGSAAIDMGMETAVFTDYDHQSRPQGTAPDIGADEFHPAPAQETHIIYLPFVHK